jgi:hypothetical protein
MENERLAKILEFKTISPFFELCRDGKKPFDIRLWDGTDKRFRALAQWRNTMRRDTTTESWRIKFTNPTNGESYSRILLDWRYIMTPQHQFILPNWIIMYLGELVESVQP